MKAGAARIDITPSLGVPLAGSCTLRPAARLADRLYAKALVLEQEKRRCAILTADLLAIDEKITARLRSHCLRRHGIGMLLCNASHTHSAPDAYNEFCSYHDRRMLALRRRYQEQLELKLRRLVANAAARMTPVRLSHGKGRAPFGINRRLKVDGKVQHMPNPKGFHDKTVSVFRFATPANKTLAVLCSYACHPTTRYDHEISADYPGPAQRLIEKKTGAIALFAQGASGDIRPNVIQPGTRPLRFRLGTQKEVDRFGNELGSEVLRILRGRLKPLKTVLEWKEKKILLPFDRFQSPAELRGFRHPFVNEKTHLILAEKIIQQFRRRKPPEGLPMQLICLRLSRNHAIFATSHELCNVYVPILQGMARGTALTVLGYTNACRAYIPTRKIRLEGGYEGEWSFCYYGLPSPFHPSVETVLLRACRRLLS